MLSASHLIIVFLVALLVFGPEKLPELARTLSKAMAEFHRLTGDFQDTLQREMRQLERDAAEQSSPKLPQFHTDPVAPTDESSPSALMETGSYGQEILGETSPSMPAMEGDAELSEPEETNAAASEAAEFKGLGHGDYSDAVSAVQPSASPRPIESSGSLVPEELPQGALSAEALPAHAPWEAANDPSEEKPSLTPGAEKPINDHPSAA